LLETTYERFKRSLHHNREVAIRIGMTQQIPSQLQFHFLLGVEGELESVAAGRQRIERG